MPRKFNINERNLRRCNKCRKYWLYSFTHISNCVYFKIFWPKCNLKTKLTFSYTVSKLDLFCHWFFYKAKKLILAGNPNETYWLIHECSWSAIWFRYQQTTQDAKPCKLSWKNSAQALVRVGHTPPNTLKTLQKHKIHFQSFSYLLQIFDGTNNKLCLVFIHYSLAYPNLTPSLLIG